MTKLQTISIGGSVLTTNEALLAASPTLVTKCPELDGGVLTIAPAELADKK